MLSQLCGSFVSIKSKICACAKMRVGNVEFVYPGFIALTQHTQI
jgi:hypothetical protein